MVQAAKSWLQVRDAKHKIGKGFGFVQFDSTRAMHTALALDGTLLRKRPVRISKVCGVSAAGLQPHRGGNIASAAGRQGAPGRPCSCSAESEEDSHTRRRRRRPPHRRQGTRANYKGEQYSSSGTSADKSKQAEGLKRLDCSDMLKMQRHISQS